MLNISKQLIQGGIIKQISQGIATMRLKFGSIPALSKNLLFSR